MTYVIHSGWWCDETLAHPGSRRNGSDNRVRSPLFFDVWYECIRTFTSPQKIIVVDSNSPLKPKVNQDVEFISLKRNFFHAENCDTKYCGWTRAFFTGAFYALMCDADYSVYVEQDCVLVGGGIIEQAIANMEQAGRKITYGRLTGLGPLIEQSFVIIKKDYILDFLTKYLSLPQTDNIFSGVAPELKFKNINKADNAWCALPFGYGRNRPINFEDAVFFAQQLTTEELFKLADFTGFSSMNILLGRSEYVQS